MLRSKLEVDKATQLLSENKAYFSEDECRRFTKIKTEIEPRDQGFKVTVSCEFVFSCQCPTPKRAIEFALIFQDKIMSFFYDYGWPSWVEKDVYKTTDDDDL